MSKTNGGNPRLDRIEKLIEQSERANKDAHARIEKDLVHMEKDLVRMEKDLVGVETNLRRWAALGVKEARSQRKRSRELDEKITKLAAAQLLTEETLQRFIASLQNGRNGH